MKISMIKTATYALLLAGAVSLGAAAQAQTFYAADSGYVTKSAGLTETNSGAKINLVDNSTTSNWDFDTYEYATTAGSVVGTPTSVSLTLYNYNVADGATTAGTYASGGSSGSNTGLLDVYLETPVVALEGASAPVTKDTEDGAQSSNVLPTFGNGDQGEGVASTFENGSTAETYVALGQYQVQTSDLTGASFSFTLSNLSTAAQNVLENLSTSSTGLGIILADDSTNIPEGVQDTFYGANASSDVRDASFTVNETPAPEASTLVSFAAAFALLGGVTFFGMKRRTNS